MIDEKIPKLKKFALSKKTRRIIITSVIIIVVFMFFIWLGMGMYVSVPEESRGELWPMFGMYGIFPMLIFFFGAKRIHSILSGEDSEEDEDGNKDSEEE